MLLSYHLFPHTFLMLIKVPQSFMSNAWMWIYWWHCAKQKWLLIQNVKCSAKYIAMKTWEMCSVFGGVGTRLCYIVCKKEKVNKNKNICNIFRPIDSLKGEKLKSWPWTSRAATVQAYSSVFKQRSHVCQQGSWCLWFLFRPMRGELQELRYPHSPLFLFLYKSHWLVGGSADTICFWYVCV